MRVAEADQAEAVDHRHGRIAAAAAAVDTGHRPEDILGIGFQLAGALQFIRQDVEQDLGVRARVDVPQVGIEKLRPELGGVGQVAVVGQRNAVGGIDVKRLGFGRAEGARGRVAHVPDADRPDEPLHVARVEHVPHQSTGLADVELHVLPGRNPGGILAAVLQDQERIVNLGAGRSVREQPDDAAHSVPLRERRNAMRRKHRPRIVNRARQAENCFSCVRAHLPAAMWIRLKPILMLVLLFGGLVAMHGCGHVISPQVMDQVDRSLDYRAIAADPAAAKGKMVLLGGTIVQAVPKPGLSEIEVVQKELDRWDAPRLTDRSEGRFIVTSERFLDPAVFSPGRGITVAGEVMDPETRRLGEIDYRYPVIPRARNAAVAHRPAGVPLSVRRTLRLVVAQFPLLPRLPVLSLLVLNRLWPTHRSGPCGGWSSRWRCSPRCISSCASGERCGDGAAPDAGAWR